MRNAATSSAGRLRDVSVPVEVAAGGTGASDPPTTYVMYVPTGQYAQPYAFRKNVSGVMPGPVPVFWNMEKK